MNTNIPTYQIQIYMAGDINTARSWLRRFAYTNGECVTLTPTSFIYTGGEEAGFIVGLVAYPRFLRSPVVLFNRAIELAQGLIAACCQRTALVVAQDQTEWVVIEPPGSKG